jgi:conjugal transfer/entry exclusion protein
MEYEEEDWTDLMKTLEVPTMELDDAIQPENVAKMLSTMANVVAQSQKAQLKMGRSMQSMLHQLISRPSVKEMEQIQTTVQVKGAAGLLVLHACR